MALPTLPPPLRNTHRQRSISELRRAVSSVVVEVTRSLIMTEDAMAKLEGETVAR